MKSTRCGANYTTWYHLHDRTTFRKGLNSKEKRWHHALAVVPTSTQSELPSTFCSGSRHAERTSNHLLVWIEAGRMCHPQKTWDGVGLLTAAPFFPGPTSYGPPICPFIFSLHLGRLVGLRRHMSEAGRAAASPPGRSLLDQPFHLHRASASTVRWTHTVAGSA